MHIVRAIAVVSVCLGGVQFIADGAEAGGAVWVRHTIDRSSRGADGVRLGDLNQDGLADVVTGWEEGGLVRVYLNPGAAKVVKPWPSVTVGRVNSPEDAVFVDLDGDGTLDVVSSCEGKTKSVFVHWAPKDRSRLLEEDAWVTAAIPAVAGKEAWMYALPMQVDGARGIDLVIGSKGRGSVSWLEAPDNPRDLGSWRVHRLREAGWIMSLEAEDVDGDGRQDVVISDRKGKRCGAFWLQHPQKPDGEWREFAIGSLGEEVMFLKVADLYAGGRKEVIVTTRNGHLNVHQRETGEELAWQTEKVRLPFGLPHGKSVAVVDIDGDGVLDLVSTNRGEGKVRCVAWQRRGNDGKWQAHDIGGTAGGKFDLIEPLDLDGDGDLDLITCEERENLGVFWYENPTK